MSPADALGVQAARDILGHRLGIGLPTRARVLDRGEGFNRRSEQQQPIGAAYEVGLASATESSSGARVRFVWF